MIAWMGRNGQVARGLMWATNFLGNAALMIALLCVGVMAAQKYLPLDKEKDGASPPAVGGCVQ